MIVNGIDLSGLAAQTGSLPARAVVPGRTVHVDGDFLAYHCSYEKQDEPKSPDEIFHNVEVELDKIKGAAGAQYSQIYLTPKESDKGGRFDIALLDGYQANRKDDPKPRFLHLTRDMMHRKLGAFLCVDHEADDGMSAAQWTSVRAGQRNLSVIATKDKDLRMVPGLHLDWSTGELHEATGFGKLQWEKDKLKGYGTIWFWAQMLMGDDVDNIGGLPKLYAPVLNRINPTAPIKKAMETLQRDPDNKKAQELMATRKPKGCGPVAAFDILSMGVKDDKTAFSVIRGLYQMHETLGDGYTNFRDGKKVMWQQAMISNMKLLWMRRTPNNPNDVIDWLQEVAS